MGEELAAGVGTVTSLVRRVVVPSDVQGPRGFGVEFTSMANMAAPGVSGQWSTDSLAFLPRV